MFVFALTWEKIDYNSRGLRRGHLGMVAIDCVTPKNQFPRSGRIPNAGR
jgi:hypothetical protein